MASAAVTVAAGGNAGATFRALAAAIVKASAAVPDINSSGASCVLTITDNPAAGVATVQVTGGPYQSAVFSV